jgi:hypothetical protein
MNSLVFVKKKFKALLRERDCNKFNIFISSLELASLQTDSSKNLPLFLVDLQAF